MKISLSFLLILCFAMMKCSGGKSNSEDATEVSDSHDGDVGDQPFNEIEMPEDIQIRLIDMQQRGSNVILFVSVTSLPEGTPVEGMTADNFMVLEDGNALSVESSLEITPRPANYVWRALILFDTSYSILSVGNLEPVVSSVQTFAHK